MKRIIYDIRNIMEGDGEDDRLLENEDWKEEYRSEGVKERDIIRIEKYLEFREMEKIKEILLKYININFDNDEDINDVINNMLKFISSVLDRDKDEVIYRYVMMMFDFDNIFSDIVE